MYIASVSGRKIKQARKQAKLTQEQLGKLIGVSGSMIGQWELEHRHPTEKTARRLCEALHCRITDLYEVQSFGSGEEFEIAWERLGGSSHPDGTEESSPSVIIGGDINPMDAATVNVSMLFNTTDKYVLKAARAAAHFTTQQYTDLGYSFSDAEKSLVSSFGRLNNEGQAVAVDRVEELAEIPKYQKTEDK